MYKDLKYTGYSTAPSDYDCKDGELTLSLNLLNEDGALHNICTPELSTHVAKNHRVVLIHSVPGQENYIILSDLIDDGSFKLAWIKRSAELKSTETAKIINISTPLHGFRDIVIVGNTLVVATASGMFYILWKDNDYRFLGNRPPFIPISFGACEVGTMSGDNIITYDNVPRYSYEKYGRSGASTPHYRKTDEDDDFWMRVSNQAFGLMLDAVADVSSKGCLFQPFFIRYAFRLYDGSHCWHSAPILMAVALNRPFIGIDTQGTSDSSLQINFVLSIPYFEIHHRIYGDIDALKEWSDIISGIDVFITQPIYTYDQNETTGEPVQYSSFFKDPYIGSAWLNTDRGRPKNAVASSEQSTPSRYFLGHWGESNGNYIDRFISSRDEKMTKYVFPFKLNPSFNDRIKNESLFYKIASLELDELKPMTAMAALPLLKADLTQINTLERLEDDFNSHATLIPGSLHTYNQRLLLCDLSIAPPPPLPFVSLVQEASQASNDHDKIPVDAAFNVRIYTRINGSKCVSEYSQPIPQKINDPVFFPLKDSFPRFIYHPDPSAYLMEITLPTGEFYSLQLKQHPFLNGSYWFGGLGDTAAGISDYKEPDSCSSSVFVGNKAYISEVNNPFVFPPSLVVSISCGRIFKLSSAAKALSQGQFGQFPLYAFTDDGIWAMEISSTGTISSRQPITRDVCLNAKSITQLDSSVLFTSARGIMLISGSQTRCLSDSISSEYPFDVSSLPLLSDLFKAHTGYNSLDSCIPTLPFSKFLENCRMVYDYIHQRIVVYNEAVSYAYVYSMKSQLWGLMHSPILYAIPSYPETLVVVDNDGSDYIADLSVDNNNPVSGLVVSRPLSLDNPDVLKTVDTVIQRGFFRKGNVMCALYGSRDLVSWFLVWSSRDHYLRGFRGSPYKFFRIALLCNLSQDESISGATVQFTPRLVNQPR